MTDPKVLVIGAGITGLNCARHLQNAGVSVLVLEGNDYVGGRIKTSVNQGFVIDEGFQVLLDSYPELRSIPGVNRLQLKAFPSGARLVSGKISGLLLNPYDSPLIFIKNLVRFPLQIHDILVLWSIWRESAGISDAFYKEKETESTMAYLLRKGVRKDLIDSFFRPFFGGVFLDPKLETGSRYFLWLFRKFGQGKACLPSGGMAKFPQWLAGSLLPNSIITGQRAEVNVNGEVISEDGRKWIPQVVVVSTGLTSEKNPSSVTRMAHTVYLQSNRSSSPPDRFIWLNGNPDAHVLHLCFPDAIQPDYAPNGKSLCALSIEPQGAEIGKERFEDWLLPQLIRDFPDLEWSSWTYLTETRVPKALPSYSGGTESAFKRKGNVWEAGDVFTYPSINGALESGRKAAEDILRSGLV